MALTRFQRFAYRHFGERAQRGARNNPHLGVNLQKAHLSIRPDVYLAMVYMTAFTVATAVLIPVLIFILLWITGLSAGSPRALGLLVPLPIVTAATVYLLALMQPDLRARNRARDINAKLPYALNYISTMASAGATPETIFSSLAKQQVYGEVASEAAWIDRDLKMLGHDIITSLNKAIDRSPSSKLQDMLQGTITVLTSGGDMKSYFRSKSEQFIFENRQEQKKFLESLGVLAESFVVVVVAAPLFLVVILSVMTMFGGDPHQMLVMGYILTLGLLPLAQAGYAVTIRTMTPEA